MFVWRVGDIIALSFFSIVLCIFIIYGLVILYDKMCLKIKNLFKKEK